MTRWAAIAAAAVLLGLLWGFDRLGLLLLGAVLVGFVFGAARDALRDLRARRERRREKANAPRFDVLAAMQMVQHRMAAVQRRAAEAEKRGDLDALKECSTAADVIHAEALAIRTRQLMDQGVTTDPGDAARMAAAEVTRT